MPLLDLPEDVLSIILGNLNPHEYLSFCRITKDVYQEYRQDSFYWRTIAAATFRLPISPLLAADGPRWYWLYKKLATQTRLYTWGQGLKGNLGHGVALPARGPVPARGLRGRPRGMIPHRPIPRLIYQRTSSSWPSESHVPDEVGVISDLQCGGWSTTILSASGKLYTTGSLDSLDGITIGESTNEFKRLEYLTQSTSAIRQFSAGRRHALALTDDGEILSWDRINAKGLKAFSRSAQDFGGKPTRVAAGWCLSSAYVPEMGIVYWTPIKNDHADNDLDGLHVKEKIIPNTAQKGSGKDSWIVTKHVVLDNFILWLTSDSKLFACHTEFDADDALEPKGHIFEVPGYASLDRELKDVQGQFQTFGVFSASGEVLAGNVDYLNRCAEAIRNSPDLITSGDWSSFTTLLASRPRDVPALQHTGVIALAYGDHHYHALHASGRITTYGRDSQCCGQLGLSDPLTGARFRGLRRNPMNPSRDGMLHSIAERRGRQIWFEPEKKDWLHWLEDTLKKPDFQHEGRAAVRAWDSWDREAMFSEWIEQEGRAWGKGPHGTSDEDSKKGNEYEDLEPYFAITIAAAGWHSGALVLVDEDKAHEVREKWVVKREEDDVPSMPGAFESKGEDEEYAFKTGGFPKVQLQDGYIMPGEGEIRLWREGQPTVQDLGIEVPQEPQVQQ